MTKSLFILVFLGLKLLFADDSSIGNFDELTFDANGHLDVHWVLYKEECAEKFAEAWERSQKNEFTSVAPMTNELSQQIHYSGLKSDCFTVYFEIGTPKAYLQFPIPTRIYNGDRDLRDFLMACQRVELGVVSYLPDTVNMYWVNPRGQRVLTTELKRGEKNTFWGGSWIGHEFELVDPKTNNVVFEITVTNNMFLYVGDAGTGVNPKFNPEPPVRETLDTEWRRSRVVQRTFTELGFAKGRLPDDLWGSIQTYYYNNRNNYVREEWETRGYAVNWWDKDAYIIGMPWDLKKYWQERVRDLVATWIGGKIDIESTAIYGMRRYEDGARLLAHVDRQATHSVSCIMNVDQGNIRTPWKLEIFDFADRLHEVTMEPGEIIYYESARCLHARMTPLDGGYFVNVFTHYRPTGDPEWYLKANPPGTPEPLINIDGLELSTLSPKNFTATSGNDLFQLWKSVGKNPSETNTFSSRSEL